MRIVRLRLAGFGPYRTEQVVDFERFADDGIFLITGKTGAGKSSILDAVCYALYASVPRFEKAEQRLRSDHCQPDDPTFVELEFSVGSESYRVRRSPEFERPKKVGTGTTTAAATAELSRRSGDSWEVLYAKPVEVGPEVIRIVGLSKDQFLQVILLAQNRFQQFLRANNDERQEVLRSLFGTARFSQIEALLAERRKALDARLGDSRTALAQLAVQAEAIFGSQPDGLAFGWFEQGEAALRAQLVDADAAVVTTTAASTAAETELARLAELDRQQRARTEATLRMERLTDAAAAVDAERVTLTAAQSAATVWPLVVARREAERELLKARDAEARARESFDVANNGDAADFIDRSTQLIGSLRDVMTEEQRLPRLRRDLGDAEATAAQLDEQIAAERSTALDLPVQIEAAAARLTASRVVAASEEAARAAVDRARARSTADRQRQRLSEQLDIARRSETTASTAHATSALRLSALMQARLDGHATELAGTLEPGTACPVCGSTSHPSPATSDAAPVTQADIDDAHTEVDALKAELDTATAARAALDVSLADAAARTDGLGSDEIEAGLSTALGNLEIARAASASVVDLQHEIDALRQRLERTGAQLEGLEARLAEQSIERATVRSAIESIEKRIEGQRDGLATVAERVQLLESSIGFARALLTAIATAAAREEKSAEATASVATALGESGFADESAVQTARREKSAIDAIVARIRSHDDDLAGARELLAQHADQPSDPVDVTGASAALGEARAERDRALHTQSVLTERVVGIARIVTEARTRFAASAGLTAEYEQVRELAQVVAGNEPNTKRMRLETYVLAAQLEQIVAAANARLRTMTSGRFSLEHDDSVQYRNTRSGLGLAILDAHTGRSRATHSLSGGETFLASLALALGLAEVVTSQTGGITLDTLFIDEGFGSLDGDTLEIAMSTLDGLREGGRTIGLISHVDSMKEQLLAQLRITVGPQGDSTIVAQDS